MSHQGERGKVSKYILESLSLMFISLKQATLYCQATHTMPGNNFLCLPENHFTRHLLREMCVVFITRWSYPWVGTLSICRVSTSDIRLTTYEKFYNVKHFRMDTVLTYMQFTC